MSAKQVSVKKTASKKSTTAATPVAAPKATKKVKAQPQEDPVQDDAQKVRTRREVSKESVDTDFAGLVERIEGEITRLRESSDKVKVRGIKFLRAVSKSLKTLHNDSKRVMKLKKKKNACRNGEAYGFLKPTRISAELATFTGWDVNTLHSRVNVTNFICKYIKDNKLFNVENERHILPDDRLKKLLGYDPSNPPKDKKGNDTYLNYFLLQRYLKHHYIKVESSAAPASKASAPVATPAAAKKATPAPKAPSKKGGKKTAVQVEDDADVDDN